MRVLVTGAASDDRAQLVGQSRSIMPTLACRTGVMLLSVKYLLRKDYGPAREVVWQAGPAAPADQLTAQLPTLQKGGELSLLRSCWARWSLASEVGSDSSSSAQLSARSRRMCRVRSAVRVRRRVGIMRSRPGWPLVVAVAAVGGGGMGKCLWGNRIRLPGAVV
mgnify:CR=1 FL=1